MKQNHPAPGWTGKGIPTTRGVPRSGPANSAEGIPVRGNSPICETRIRDGTEYSWQKAVGNCQAAGWRVFLTAHLIAKGLHVYSHHIAGFNQRNKPCCLPVYIAVGFNQRNRNTHAKAGLQPHQEKMRLEPDLPHCNLTRQLKQTAMQESMHPPGKVIELQIRDGKPVRIRDDTEIHIPFNPKGRRSSAGIAVGFSQRNSHTHVSTGLQPHQEEMWVEPDLPHCNLTRQLKQTAMQESTHPPGKGIELQIRDGTPVRIRDDTETGAAKSHSLIRDGTLFHPRDGTVIRIRDGTPVRIRDDTELRIRDGTIVTRIRDGTPIRIRDDTEINIRDGTFLREKISKEPAFKKTGTGKLCTKNNRETGVIGSGMEEVGRSRSEQ